MTYEFFHGILGMEFAVFSISTSKIFNIRKYINVKINKSKTKSSPQFLEIKIFRNFDQEYFDQKMANVNFMAIYGKLTSILFPLHSIAILNS